MKLHITTLLYIVLLANTAQTICMDGSFTTNNGIPIAPMELTFHEPAPINPIEWAKPLDSTVVQIAYDHAPFRIKTVVNTMQEYPTKVLAKRNYLFVGPSGAGKTTLARAMAQAATTTQRTQWYCKLIRVGKLGTKYQNSATEGLIAEINPILRSNTPCVIVLDELTHITKNYNQDNNYNNDAALPVWQILDECNERDNIIIVGTTNDESDLPTPLKSRFNDRGIVRIKPPSVEIRASLLNHLFQQLNLDEPYIAMLAKKTNGKSFRDIIDFSEQVTEHAEEQGHEAGSADIDAVMATWRAWYHPYELYNNCIPSKQALIKSLPITLPLVVSGIGIAIGVWQFTKQQRATANHAIEQLRIANEQLKMQKEATAKQEKEKAAEWHWGWRAAGTVAHYGLQVASIYYSIKNGPNTTTTPQPQSPTPSIS